MSWANFICIQCTVFSFILRVFFFHRISFFSGNFFSGWLHAILQVSHTFQCSHFHFLAKWTFWIWIEGEGRRREEHICHFVSSLSVRRESTLQRGPIPPLNNPRWRSDLFFDRAGPPKQGTESSGRRATSHYYWRTHERNGRRPAFEGSHPHCSVHCCSTTHSWSSENGARAAKEALGLICLASKGGWFARSSAVKRMKWTESSLSALRDMLEACGLCSPSYRGILLNDLPVGILDLYLRSVLSSASCPIQFIRLLHRIVVCLNLDTPAWTCLSFPVWNYGKPYHRSWHRPGPKQDHLVFL